MDEVTGGGENMELLPNGYRDYAVDDEKGLEIDGGGDYIAM